MENDIHAETLRKAQLYDLMLAKEQVAKLSNRKPSEPVRIKSIINKVWLDDGCYLARGEVLEVPADQAKLFVTSRQADVTDEPVTQAAIERHATQRGQKQAAREAHEREQKRRAAVDAAIRGM